MYGLFGNNYYVEDIELDVPFSEIAQAKGLGAKWDSELRVWYIPISMDAKQFAKWIPNNADNEHNGINSILDNSPYLLESLEKCYKCDSLVKVFCLASDGFTKTNHNDADKKEYANFVIFKNLSYVDDAKFINALKEIARNYKLAFIGQNISSRIYVNHCDCGAKFSDFYLHKIGGAFYPASNIRVKMIIAHHLIEFANVGIFANHIIQGSNCIAQYAQVKKISFDSV